MTNQTPDAPVPVPPATSTSRHFLVAPNHSAAVDLTAVVGWLAHGEGTYALLSSGHKVFLNISPRSFLDRMESWSKVEHSHVSRQVLC